MGAGRGRRRAGVRAAVVVLLVLGLGVAGCSDGGDDGDGGDEAAEGTTDEGGVTGPTTGDGATTTTVGGATATTEPVVPEVPAVPEPGGAALVVGADEIDVELSRCAIEPGIGLDMTMNPPGTTQENPAGFILIVADPQPGVQELGAEEWALQLPGGPILQGVRAQLDLADDRLSGTVQFLAAQGEQPLLGAAAFACDPAG